MTSELSMTSALKRLLCALAAAFAPALIGLALFGSHLTIQQVQAASDASPEQSASASSNQSDDEADSEKTDSDRDQTPIETKTLDNGLTVIAIPDPSLPIATIELAVRHGAFAESDEFNGLSHLYEHMCFKANKDIPDQEAFLARQRELGIVFNGSTSHERVNYYFTLPTSNLEPGLKLMSSAVRTPVFKDKEFKREKQVVLSEFNRRQSQPSYRLRDKMRTALWGELANRKDILGDRKVIANATVKQMKHIQDTYYVPNNAALIIAGDVTGERAFSLADKVFGDWKQGDDPFEKEPVPKHKKLTEPKFVVAEGDVKVPSLQFAFQGPSVDEEPEMTYAADVLSFILGQSTSKFHKRLVDEGPALGVGLSYYTLRHTGPIYGSAQANPDKLKQTVRDLYTELHRLTDPDYFTDEQLDNAKTILATREIYNREKTSSYAHTVSFWWAVDGVGYYRDYVQNLRAVTRKDISEYVEKYVVDQPYVLGVLVNEKTRKKLDLSDKALRKLVREARINLKPDGQGDSNQK